MSKIKKWELIEEKDISPSPWFPLFKHKVRLPNGKVIDDFYVSKLGDVGMVVAVTNNKEIVFVRQYKHGINDVILELPAGRIEDNKPIDAAQKELEEETGIVAKELFPLGKIHISPTKDSTTTHGFLVKDIIAQKKQNLDNTEDIEVEFIPINDIDRMISSGEIKAADTIAFLTIAKLKFPELFN